jgi:hypothetical protein
MDPEIGPRTLQLSTFDQRRVGRLGGFRPISATVLNFSIRVGTEGTYVSRQNSINMKTTDFVIVIRRSCILASSLIEVLPRDGVAVASRLGRNYCGR